MNERKKILFKINGVTVVTETRDLSDTDIEKMKWIVVEECEALYDEIKVEYESVAPHKDLSEYDVTDMGIIDYKDCYFKVITGITFKGDTDDFLDAINNNLEKYLVFS